MGWCWFTFVVSLIGFREASRHTPMGVSVRVFAERFT